MEHFACRVLQNRILNGARRAGLWLVTVLTVLGLVIAAPAQPARAFAAFTVTTTVDSVDANPGNGACADSLGRCSLRAAVMETNALPGADVITLPAGTYTLTIANADVEGENNALTGDLDVLDHLTIIGGGGDADADPSLTIIQAGTNTSNGIDKVFSINPYFNTPFNTVFQALTIRYGYNRSSGMLGPEQPGDGWGGGLDWDAAGTGTLTIDNCVITGNTVSQTDGGGIALYDAENSNLGRFTMTRSVVSNNHAPTGTGGGIFIGPYVPASITGSTVDGNTSFDDGGGVYQAGNTIAQSLLIERSTISSNTASGSASVGGGLIVFANALIRNSTISGNTAPASGGGIYMHAPTLGDPPQTLPITMTLTNVTITNNRANADGAGSETGGGVYHNSAAGSTLVAYNSLMIGNFTGPGTTIDNVYGGLDPSSANNLFAGPATNLGPLANNGGPTFTHALLPGSDAIEAGNNAYAAATDQRGMPRVADSADLGTTATVDLGAYEAYPTVQDVPNQMALAGQPRILNFRVGDVALGIDSVTASFSNATLFPPGSYSIDCTVDTCTLSMTPASGQTGTATVTLTVTGGGRTAQDTFDINVVTTQHNVFLPVIRR